MNKKILIIFFILLLAITVNAGKCWYVNEFSTSTNPTYSWTPSSARPLCIDGTCWNRVVFSNSQLNVSQFGNYNRLCDNGVRDTTLNFVVLDINNITNNTYSKKITNIPANGPAGSISLPYCTTTKGFNKHPCTLNAPGCDAETFFNLSNASDRYIGKGSLNEINFIITNEFGNTQSQMQKMGGYTLDLKVMKEPIAGTFGQTPERFMLNDRNFYFAPPASLFILPLGDDTIGFYDTFGNYIKDVYYTIKAQTFINLTVKNIEIECSDGSTCAIIDPRDSYTVTKDNDILIIGARITIPKNNIPKEINYKLKLDYDITNLVNLGSDYQDINVESGISRLKMGYLDKQDFQIKINSSQNSESCIGYNGLIGNTGEAFAPRINVNTNFSDGFDVNICSPENENWVYCSQRETLAILANKIYEIFNLYYRAEQTTDVTEKNEIYSEINNKKTFEIYLRNVNFSNINTVLPDEEGLFEHDPFEMLGGATQIERISRAKNLFNEVDFFDSNGISSTKKYKIGKYLVNIDMFGPTTIGGTNVFSDLASEDVTPNLQSNLIFDESGNLIDPEKLNIQINFNRNGGKPLLDWFFYEEGIENITNQIQSKISTLSQTQIDRRGQIMYFNQDLTNFEISDIKTYPNYAIPFFIKVDKNQTTISNNLIITSTSPDELTELSESAFSYWTGFASNLENGCGEMLTEEKALVYRLDDKLTAYNPTQATNEFLIELYPNIGLSRFTNGREYLQTVIYSPIYNTGNPFSATINSKNIGFGKSLFGKNNTCDNLNNCNLEITKDNSNYIVNNSSAIPDIINGIKNNEICVTRRQDGTNNLVEWIIFWNEEEILKDLRSIKDTVLDDDDSSKYCAGLLEQRN